VKQISGALLKGRLLALPTNIKSGWKGLPDTNALAYYENSKITPVKSFITLVPGVNFINLLKCNLLFRANKLECLYLTIFRDWEGQ
jgi:hypothetical protein